MVEYKDGKARFKCDMCGVVIYETLKKDEMERAYREYGFVKALCGFNEADVCRFCK